MDFKKMQEIIPPHSAGHLATACNGKPDIRGWQLQLIEDGKIYFATSSSKNVYKQLQENSECSFMCTASGNSFRINGKAIFVTDEETIKRIYDQTDVAIKGIYPSYKENGFTVFYLEHGTVKHAEGFAPFQSFEY